jgi:squalene-associated FAD-dependent desaturase
VEIVEAAPQAGGRCRSYFDPTLGQTIDNGNHFVLSGNHATMSYLRTIGAEKGLVGPRNARTSFVDIRSGERWTIAPNDSFVPLWLFDRSRRVPETRPSDYLELAKLLTAGPGRTIQDVLSCKGELWERLLRPFFLGALNTQPEIASAALAGALVRETFAKGGHAYRTRIAHPNLASVFVDPALAFLSSAGATLRLGERLRRIIPGGRHVAALEVQESTIPLSSQDAVVVATPPWVTSELLPATMVPDEFSGIVNAHFKTSAPSDAPGMLGIIGGTAEWVFSFPDRVSVTISGADRLLDVDREELARTIWSDVHKALALEEELPEWQIVKERRATFRATPDQVAKRAGAKTEIGGLYLAGDWTDTGLPATIEGAVRSGRKAAELALKHSSLL